jgi:peptide/nickel transport system ATP-binding protein
VTPLLELRAVRKSFVHRGSAVHAVRDVSLVVPDGEIVGLVGESGSGKSTVANLVLGLERPDAGEIRFRGRDLSRWLAGSGRPYRAEVQAVFQDPVQAMDGRKRIGWSVAEPLVIHGTARGPAARARVAELFDAVHLDPALADRFPHQVSGGQAQRANIARALALRPSLLVCDEAVSALDVSVQAQILNLLEEVKEANGLSMLFVAHDLAVVKNISDRVMVMYLGRVCEVATAATLFSAARHPYTAVLLASIPDPDPDRAARPLRAVGELPSPIDPPSGCRFRTRCPAADARCAEDVPELVEIETDHWVACHHPTALPVTIQGRTA